MVDEGHLLQVDGVGGDGLVALVHETELPDEGVVRLLAVVDDGGPLPDVLLEASLMHLVDGLPFSLTIASVYL